MNYGPIPRYPSMTRFYFKLPPHSKFIAACSTTLSTFLDGHLPLQVGRLAQISFLVPKQCSVPRNYTTWNQTTAQFWTLCAPLLTNPMFSLDIILKCDISMNSNDFFVTFSLVGAHSLRCLWCHSWFQIVSGDPMCNLNWNYYFLELSSSNSHVVHLLALGLQKTDNTENKELMLPWV